MKKVLIACFFAIIMLVVPFTTVAHPSEIPDIKNAPMVNLTTPEFYLEPDQYVGIAFYIETNYIGEEKDQAYAIINGIIGEDLKVDAIKLAEAWEDYAYQPIPQEDLDDIEIGDLSALQALILAHWALNIFGGLVNFVTSLIKNRLGWLYFVINEGYDLCVDGVFLAINIVTDSFELLLAIVDATNLMLTVPQIFSEMIQYLFNQQFNEFLDVLGDFIGDFLVVFGKFLQDLFDWIDDIPEVINYLLTLVNFVGYFIFKPWLNKIHITGKVRKNFIPVTNANVTCKDITIKTDDQGNFHFAIEPDTWDDSFPPNSFYGFHNLQLTIEKDGKIVKTTPTALSFVCSGGSMNWPIFIIKGRSRSPFLQNGLLRGFYNLLEMLQIIFPNIFRQIRRINTQTI